MELAEAKSHPSCHKPVAGSADQRMPHLIAHNTGLNLVGQLIPVLIGLLTVPWVIRNLGADRFGLLSFAWVLLGGFTIFNLGLGRATTKFVAEYRERDGEASLPRLIWTSLVMQAGFGLVGGFVFAGCIPLLVGRMLRNSAAALMHEARLTLLILAISVPIILVSIAARGVLEGLQRFDRVNVVRTPLNTMMFLIPAVVLPFGIGLTGMVLLLVICWAVAGAIWLIMCMTAVPGLRCKVAVAPSMVPPLLRYGGWVTVSSVLAPALQYLDRFLVGALVSIAAVGYYSVPCEIVGRFQLIPASLVPTLFPAFSALGTFDSRATIERLYFRSTKYLLLLLGPIFLVLIFFAKMILSTWLGAEFARQSAMVLSIVALGILINSVAWIPYSLLQGLGRPDVPAKFHLAEVVGYAGLAYFLTSKWGVVGAALALTLRLSVDALLLFLACRRLGFVSQPLFRGGVQRSVVLLIVIASALYATLFLPSLPFGMAWVIRAALLSGFFMAAWWFALDSSERDFLTSFRAFRRIPVAVTYESGS